MYPQQWQSDQQNQIIAKIAGKMPGKTNEGKRKNNERIITIQVADAVAVAKAILSKEDADDAEEAEEDAAEEETTIVSI
jgi:hypothetical protein